MTQPFIIRRLEGEVARQAMQQFAPFHYRAGAPAVRAGVWGAWDGQMPESPCVGVLVLSMPTLNAPWRALAWPERFGSRKSPRAQAHCINASVRTIARVIVEPRWRGLGVATALVRTYLRSPDTPCTETLTSLGNFFPLFSAVGMREVIPPTSRRDRDCVRTLAALGLDGWELLDARRAAVLLRDPALAHAVRRWARASKATRRHLKQGDAKRLRDLAALAGSAACARPRVYVWP
jgi:GNAT superfamily N-acetyltransferase